MKIIKKTLVFQGFSRIPILQYFSVLTSIFTYFSPIFHQKAPHLCPRSPHMGSFWGPKGVLGELLAPFVASLAPSGEPWAPHRGSPSPSWQHFSQFRSPKTPPSSIFHRFFMSFYTLKHKILNMKITDFHTDLPSTYHTYFLYFQSLQSFFPSNSPVIQASSHLLSFRFLQSFFPSNPPVIQTSKHPIWAWRNARSV